MKDFHGKVAVITGAASGLGREFANTAAGLGMKLVLADVQPKALEHATEELLAAGAEVLAMVCDVSKASHVQELADAAIARFHHVHLVFNNAGVGCGGLVWENSEQDWEWVLGVNLMGVVHGVRVFTRVMLECARRDPGFEGHIVNTASMAGLLTPPAMGVYNVSKHAVVGLTRCVATEMGPHRIGVNAICPGVVDTDMLHDSFGRTPETAGRPIDEVLAPVLARVAMKRVMQVDEISGMAVFLASSEASGMTGQSVVIDGGMLYV